ncbi:hypothetical protein FF1_042004 [Malus domestica]
MAISKMNRLRGGKYKGENGGGMGNGEEGDSSGGMIVRKKGTEDAAVQRKSNMDDKSFKEVYGLETNLTLDPNSKIKIGGGNHILGNYLERGASNPCLWSCMGSSTLSPVNRVIVSQAVHVSSYLVDEYMLYMPLFPWRKTLMQLGSYSGDPERVKFVI